MTYPATNDQDYPRMTSAVQALIAINVVILFLQMTIVQPDLMLGALGFNFATAPTRWWTVGTYIVVHAGFWHAIWNMYTLFFFDPRLDHRRVAVHANAAKCEHRAVATTNLSGARRRGSTARDPASATSFARAG